MKKTAMLLLSLALVLCPLFALARKQSASITGATILSRKC